MDGLGNELIDIFSFVKGYNLAFDISSEWFQDLWYPLNHNQPPLGGGLVVVGNRPILVTHNLLEWMGYKGRDVSDKQERFTRLLESLAIEYPDHHQRAQTRVDLHPTHIYAQERIFKIGSTSRLSSRIPQYNTGRPTSDRFYYAWAIKCYNSKDVDYHILRPIS